MDRDTPFDPSGDVARPVNRPTGITRFLFTLGGIGMLFSPITMFIGHHHHTPDQDPATCEYYATTYPDQDPAAIGCDEEK